MIVFNGRSFDDPDKLFNNSNRSFLYGDGIFETIRVENGSPLFLKDHFLRFLKGLNVLGLTQGRLNDYDSFYEAVMGYIKASEMTQVRMRLQATRSGNGFYTPESATYDYLISAAPLKSGGYEEGAGMSCGICTSQPKAPGRLSAIKSTSALVYVHAALEGKLLGMDEMLLLNPSGNVIESTRANLFLMRDGKAITPPLSEGCLDGVMRKQVMELLSAAGNPCTEAAVSLQDLETADALLLTNVVQGIGWIRQLGNRSYSGEWSQRLTKQLNDRIRSQLSA